MKILIDETSRPVWHLDAFVTHSGKEYRYWYEYDERTGDTDYEFIDNDGSEADSPNDKFDFDAFDEANMAEINKLMEVA